MEWRCSCGERAVEIGDGEGLRTIRAHQLHANQAEGGGHKILGLYRGPEDDAELLVAGPKLKAAIAGGYIEEDAAAERRATAKDTAGSSGGTGGEGAKKAARSNLEGIVPLARIRLHPKVWFWVSVLKPYATKDDGGAYTDTDADMGEFISDSLEDWGRHRYAQLLGIDAQSEIMDRMVRIAQGSLSLPRGPQAVIPPVSPEDIADRIETALDMVAARAHDLAARLAASAEEEAAL